jgi:hypothetical protein
MGLRPLVPDSHRDRAIVRLADPITIRHAMTFMIGLAGLAALLPMGRLTIGGWAGVVAIVLCLTTGYFYGHLFFTLPASSPP